MKSWCFAARYVLRRRGRLLLPAVILALGIGATVTVFSVLDASILQSLPFPDSDRLVAIYSVRSDRRSDPAATLIWDRGTLTWAISNELVGTRAFEQVGAWYRSSFILLAPAQDVVEGSYVSRDFLALIGAKAAVGRLFTLDDDRYYGPSVILSYQCWRERFGGRADIVGRTLAIALTPGEPETKIIVGVLAPETRTWYGTPELFLPIGLRAGLSGAGNYAVAKLSAGTSSAAAQDAVDHVIRSVEGSQTQEQARVAPLADEITGSATSSLWWLSLAATGLLLLIACANASALILVDWRDRYQEIALRYCLGATPAALLAQSVTEYLFIVGVGGFAGAAMTWVCLPLVRTTVPASFFFNVVPALTGRVVIFAVSITAAVTAIFAWVPTLAWSFGEIAVSPRASRGTETRRSARVQRAIVLGQIAVALTLVVCAVLLGETIRRLSSLPLGFDASDVFIVSMKPTRTPATMPGYEGVPLFSSWMHTAGLLGRIGSLPGVTSAAGMGTAPFSSDWRSVRLQSADVPGAEADALVMAVTEGYFRTLRLPLLSGRLLQSDDRQRSPGDRERRVVISRGLERRLARDGAIGKRFIYSPRPGSPPIVFIPVGVVADARVQSLSVTESPIVYVLDSTFLSVNTVVVRMSAGRRLSLLSVQQTVAQFDPSIVVAGISRLASNMNRSIETERFRAEFSVACGLVALLLAAVGIYGLGKARVTQRRRELGIRIALGASKSQMRLLIANEAAKSILGGVALGAPLAFSAVRMMRASLHEISPTSQVALAASITILAVTGALSIFLPAHRATTVDPVELLRE